MLQTDSTPSLEVTRAYGMIHVAVFLFGFTAILGKLIELPGATIVWYRMVITGISLCFFPAIFAHIRRMSQSDLIKIAGIGVLVTLHWVAFYEAIKYSNASITLSCLASTSFFTAFLEPLIFRRKIKPEELLLGGMVILGFVLIFGFSGEDYWVGMVIAIISAVLAALFSVLNKTIVSRHDVYGITLVQFATGVAFLLLMSPVYMWLFPQTQVVPSLLDTGYLFVLALLCTTLAYTLSMRALKHLSAFTTNLAINLEPVYGILMAYFILNENEELNPGFYAGSAVILFSVLLHAWLTKGRHRLARRKSRNH